MARGNRVSDLSRPAAPAVRRAREAKRDPGTAKGAVVAETSPPADDFESDPGPGPVVFGSLQGRIRIAEDFDEPLDEFAPYR